MSAALIAVTAAVLLAPCSLRLGWLHPVTVTVLLWLLIGVFLAVRPLDLVQPSLLVAVVVTAGLTALCLPAVVLGGPSRRQPEAAVDGVPPYRLVLRVRTLVVVTVLVLAAVVYGLLQYRAAVSAALGGTPFSRLDPQLVRWAELYGNVKLSSTANFAFGLAPLLGGVAVIGGLCHRWWWFLLFPLTLYLVTQSPSRTATLSVAASTVFFFLLLATAPTDRLRARRLRLGRGGVMGLLAAACAAAFGYFTFVGQQLDKASLPPGLVPARWVPGGLVQPLLYELGGLSAFTTQLQHPVGPGGPFGHPGRSVYGVVKLLQMLGLPAKTPNPFGAYVNIPVSFNTYSAFGDTYFDLGLAGVIGVFLVMGLVVAGVTRWPWPGHPVSTWVLATLASVLMATPLYMRFLDGDIVIQAVAGSALLALVLRREAPAVVPGPGPGPALAPRPTEAVA